VVGEVILTGHALTSDALIDEFRELRNKYPAGPALFHSRITTAGLSNIDNCHPFNVGGNTDTVIAHNGILPELWQPAKGDLRSDTAILAARLNVKLLASKMFRATLGEAIGTDKLVILSTNPLLKSAYLINAHRGNWHAGAWWSNSSFRGWESYVVGKPVRTSAGAWWQQQGTSGTWTTQGREGSTPVVAGDNLCIVCNSLVSYPSRWCRTCDLCGDCGRDDRDCLCYVPSSTTKAIGAGPTGASGTVDDSGEISEEEWESGAWMAKRDAERDMSTMTDEQIHALVAKLGY
jgi:hypothetical protein